MSVSPDHCRFVLFILAVSIVLIPAAWGQQTYWTNASVGDWLDATNWDNGVPGSGSQAYLDQGTAQLSTAGQTATARYVHIGTVANGHIVHNEGDADFTYMYFGEQEGSLGRYELADNGHLRGSWLLLGGEGRGEFIHTGGLLQSDSGIIVGWTGGTTQLDATPSGYYEMSGSAALYAATVSVGPFSRGTFIQSDGTSDIGLLEVGQFGEVSVAGGSMSVDRLTAYNDHTLFDHTAGLVEVRDQMTIGDYSTLADAPIYRLGDAASLTAHMELIGWRSPGRFEQLGGTNTADYLGVRQSSVYDMHAGVLTINHGAYVDGVLNFQNQAVQIDVGNDGYVNMGAAAIAGSSNASMTVGSNTLVVFPPDFDPYGDLGSFVSSGRTHIAGNTFYVGPGEEYSLFDDFTDHVEVAGTLNGTHVEIFHSLRFTHGLNVLPGGAIYNSDELRVDDAVSGMSGGSMIGDHFIYVGYNGSGVFTQTAGDNHSGRDVGIGVFEGTHGHYTLSGGSLQARTLRIERGVFRQLGGTAEIAEDLYLTHEGRCEIDATAQLSVLELTIGGTDPVFQQTGGTVNVSSNPWGSGGTIFMGVGYENQMATYELAAGLLTTDRLHVGFVHTGRRSEFAHTGGDCQVSDALVIGSNDRAEGRYELSGNATLVTGETRVGRDGHGQLNHLGGSHTTGRLIIGREEDALGQYRLEGGQLDVTGELVVGQAGEGILEIAGAGASVQTNLYIQGTLGTLKCVIDASGISLISVGSTAALDGAFIVEDLGAGFGRFDVLLADGGLISAFDTVVLPDPDWSWGIDNGTALWVAHVPEPTSVLLLALTMLTPRLRCKRCRRTLTVGSDSAAS